MPTVTNSTFSEGFLGTQKIGAVMAGTSEMYVRVELHSFITPGNFTFTLPDWATAYGVVLSGGGGGGQAGGAALNRSGRGGNGGKVTGVWGRMSNPNLRVMSGVVGAGGAGGTETAESGQNGGATSITTHASNQYTAAGGTAYRSEPKQDGLRTQMNFSDLFSRYINMPPGSTYTNGPAGTGNGGSGTRGGGGAGGDGGVFGNYSKGGRGGHGYVDIYVWGLPRHQGGKVQITLGSDLEARDQFRAALSDRGYNYQTIKYIPFEIELVGSGSARELFRDCSSLKSAPDLNTSNVTSMRSMFNSCVSLTSVPDMITSGVTNTEWMFEACSSLTDGNVRLIGKHTSVKTTSMITGSGLTRLPFYNTAGNPI